MICLFVHFTALFFSELFHRPPSNFLKDPLGSPDASLKTPGINNNLTACSCVVNDRAVMKFWLGINCHTN